MNGPAGAVFALFLICVFILIIFFCLFGGLSFIYFRENYIEYRHMMDISLDFEDSSFTTKRTDRWKMPYRILYEPKVIWSAGRDKKFGTRDDIIWSEGNVNAY